MKLPFAPACLPLLLGGLPHRNAAQALELSRRYAGALLAWPQLPERSFREQSFVQSAIGFPGLVVDAAHSRVYVDRERAEQAIDRLALAYLEDHSSHAALVPDDAAGLDELLRQGECPRGTLALKGQLLGPISLAAQLTDEHDRPLIYDDMLFEALVQHLRLRVEWQESRLRGLGVTTIICLDEPFLDAVGLSFLPLDWERAREQIDQVLAGVRGCRALFAGGAVDWREVLRASVELIIADVYEHGPALTAAAAELPGFLDRGGVVGLGVVPADEDALDNATARQLVGQIAGLAHTLERDGIATERLLRQAVISTSGTLNRLTIAGAERAMQLTAEVSKLLRQQYALA
ncbi:MAG: hypothetical protein IPO81_31680 [Kouleothrix sp.]|nr:hypothetical protein [Kouleothrix sp.]